MNLKDNVLAELIHNGNSYISGSQLAKKFNVSRTAIWKCIEQLKDEGCQIGAVTKRGYILLSIPDLFNLNYMETLLANCKTKWQVQFFDEIDSTNNYAKKLAYQGAPAGTVIVANKQTAGKGRLGKSFHSPSGGLYFSIILRPDLPLKDMMSVTACTAAAIHEALLQNGISTKIKWVNDLFLNEKKVCGILSEGSFNAELLSMDYLVIGIGINIHPDPNLPDELKNIVTDIQTATGKVIRRCDLVAQILAQLEELLAGLAQHTYLPIYTENSCTLGHRVHVKASQGECDALAIGFTEDAGLIVRLSDGTQEIIRTGTAQIID
ncbi:MAG: biotin--[acetyl-CoA-carboxylase] ligase [Oscillospiraceae bacterium]